MAAKKRPICSKEGCRGTLHVPTCPVYVAAMQEWASRIPKDAPKDKRTGHHGERPPGQETTPEERSEIARRNGAMNPGRKYPLPLAAIQILKKGGFRVRKEFMGDDEISKAARELAGGALEQLARIAWMGGPSRRAPTAAKAQLALRDEICDPVAKVTNVNVNDLGKALDAIEGKDKP